MVLALAFLGTSTTTYAQLSAQDISITYNKTSKQLEVIKKSDNSNITNQFTLEIASLDIFDNGGSYAGSIEMKAWAVPVDQFAPGEIIKIASICVKETSSGKSIELNDIPLDWE